MARFKNRFSSNRKMASACGINYKRSKTYATYDPRCCMHGIGKTSCNICNKNRVHEKEQIQTSVQTQTPTPISVQIQTPTSVQVQVQTQTPAQVNTQTSVHAQTQSEETQQTQTVSMGGMVFEIGVNATKREYKIYLCEHGNNTRKCNVCRDNIICSHGKYKSYCKECDGNKLCKEHGYCRFYCFGCQSSRQKGLW